MSEYGVVVTVNLMGTNWKNTVKQFKLLDKILGHEQKHMEKIMTIVQPEWLYIVPKRDSIEIKAITSTLQQAANAKHYIVCHINKIRRHLRTFLQHKGLPLHTLILQTDAVLAPLDDRECQRFFIRSQMVVNQRPVHPKPWFNNLTYRLSTFNQT